MGGGDDAPDNTPQAYIGKSWRLEGGMDAQVQAPHRCKCKCRCMFLEERVILRTQIVRRSITRWAQLLLAYAINGFFYQSYIRLSMHGVKVMLFNLQQNIKETLLGIYDAR
jgi:hypothetical protein